MLISRDMYTVFIFVILACAFLPFFYHYVKERKKKYWFFLILLVLVPIDMYTPSVLTVKACGEYTQQVLIFPTKDFTNGYHSYIVNESDSPIYLETVIYTEKENTNPDINEKDLEYMIIPAKETCQRHSSKSPDYLFIDAPENIQIDKGKVELRYRLSCDSFSDMEFDFEDFDFEETESQSDVSSTAIEALVGQDSIKQ